MVQVEQMKDGLEELKEKLKLTQSRLEAERADSYRTQQVGLAQPQRTVQFNKPFNMQIKCIQTRYILY